MLYLELTNVSANQPFFFELLAFHYHKPVFLRRRLSLCVRALQARLRGKAAPCRLMHMLMPPRFRRLLIDSDAGPLYSAVSSSIPPSAQFRLLAAVCSI